MDKNRQEIKLISKTVNWLNRRFDFYKLIQSHIRYGDQKVEQLGVFARDQHGQVKVAFIDFHSRSIEETAGLS